MFFPIVIGQPPSGKLGLVYAGAWLAFALLVMYSIKPLIDYKIDTDPRFQMEVIHIDQSAAIWLQIVGYASLILGLIALAVVGYELYKQRKEATP